MSREIDVGVKAGQYTVGGKYVTQFREPLIIKLCEHLIDKEKKRFKDEIWYLMAHGKADGSSEVSKHCEKLK
jgi:hypothetical protein